MSSRFKASLVLDPVEYCVSIAAILVSMMDGAPSNSMRTEGRHRCAQGWYCMPSSTRTVSTYGAADGRVTRRRRPWYAVTAASSLRESLIN